jgi:hypothetical protein
MDAVGEDGNLCGSIIQSPCVDEVIIAEGDRNIIHNDALGEMCFEYQTEQWSRLKRDDRDVQKK